MFCIYCGAKIPDDSLFCEKCGKKIAPASHHKAEHAAQTSVPNEEAAQKIPAPPQAEPFRQAEATPQVEPSRQAEPASQPAPEKDRPRKPRPSPASLRHTVAAVLVLASPLAFFWFVFWIDDWGFFRYRDFIGEYNDEWQITILTTLFCFLLAMAAVLLFRARKTLPRKKLAMLWGGIGAASLVIFYILYNAIVWRSLWFGGVWFGNSWRARNHWIFLIVYCLILTAVGAALLWWESKGKK